MRTAALTESFSDDWTLSFIDKSSEPLYQDLLFVLFLSEHQKGSSVNCWVSTVSQAICGCVNNFQSFEAGILGYRKDEKDGSRQSLWFFGEREHIWAPSLSPTASASFPKS